MRSPSRGDENTLAQPEGGRADCESCRMDANVLHLRLLPPGEGAVGLFLKDPWN